ncbi:MAG: ABC transporter permease [Clostridium sp.]|nr:ABC transporter permease [Clostridium sp.]
MTDLIHEIGQSLNRNRTRTALTGIAVVWGIFMLVSLLGLARGTLNAFDYNMSQRNMETVTIWGGRTVYPYKGYEAGRWIQLQTSDCEPIVRNNSRFVRDVVPYMNGESGLTVSSLDKTLKPRVAGVMPRQIEIEPVDILAGRFINQPDIDGRRRVMVISSSQARQLFGLAEDAVGKTLGYASLAWQVVGVYDHPWRSEIYVPFTTLNSLKGDNPNVGQMTVMTRGLKTEEDVRTINDGIISTLARLHDFDPREGDAGGIWMWNRFESYLKSAEGNRILLIAVWVIGIMTLLSGIVGISNIMFVSVKERTHEIGIRRAIGAKPRSILGTIVSESVAITALFGYIGIVLGMTLVAVIGHFFGESDALRDPGISLTMAVELTLMLVAAGALAGLFPAIKATKVKPVEALRDE